MGIIGAAFGLGFVLGPAIGGVPLALLARRSRASPPPRLAAANGVAAFFILPEPEHRDVRGDAAGRASPRSSTEIAAPRASAASSSSTSSPCSPSARWRRPTRFLAKQRYGLDRVAHVALPVRLHRRARRDRAGRAHRPAHAALRREAAARRRARPAGGGARRAALRRRRRRACSPPPPRSRSGAGLSQPALSVAPLALRAGATIRAARSGSASPPPRSGAIIGPDAGDLDVPARARWRSRTSGARR